MHCSHIQCSPIGPVGLNLIRLLIMHRTHYLFSDSLQLNYDKKLARVLSSSVKLCGCY